MTKFVEGPALSQAIREVLAGEHVRCAVAFWGRGALQLLEPSAKSEGRIICDVTLGGTSPDALIELGAPNSTNIRHIPRLHAKLYLSDLGAVVTSANASDNGIGFKAPAQLSEAGVSLGATELGYADAVAWFETLWSTSQLVDNAALAEAAKWFRPYRVPADNVRPGSLLDLVKYDPDAFAGISFVLSERQISKEGIDRARSAVLADQPAVEETVSALPNTGIFTDWEPTQVDRWARFFIEFWMPKQRLTVYGREAFAFERSTGTVMSSRSWRGVRESVPFDLPTAKEIEEVDAEKIRQLLHSQQERVFSGRELAEAMTRLSL